MRRARCASGRGTSTAVGTHAARPSSARSRATSCCSRKCRDEGADLAARTRAALSHLGACDVVGGDWNHSLTGPERVGSLAGRTAILEALAGRGLRAPTATLPHRLEGLASIDHVAVPAAWPARAERVGARPLSDHDAYVVSVG